jgi:hypothetical protein
MSKSSRQARRAQTPIPMAVATIAYPRGILDGILFTMKLVKPLLSRPFAWIRPAAGCLMMFLPIAILLSTLLAAIIFGRVSEHTQQLGQGLILGFLPWFFTPMVLSVSFAGNLIFLGHGKLGYRLALEPLRSRTGALVALGSLALLLGIALSAGVRALSQHSGWAVFLGAGTTFLLVRSTVAMATAEVWANEASAWAGVRWAIMAWKHTWKSWIGIWIGMVILITLVVGSLAGISYAIGALKLSPTAMMACGAVMLTIIFLLASWALAIDGMVSLAMHSRGSDWQDNLNAQSVGVAGNPARSASL